MPVNFFDPSTQVDPQQQMAVQLMQRGMQAPQGQTVSGHYVAPPVSSYATQLADALAGGYKMNQINDGRRAQDLLNGGTGESPLASGIGRMGNWLGGMFGGGA